MTVDDGKSGQTEKVFLARTLGLMDIRYGGESLRLPVSSGGKVIQLLLLLILAGDNGISRMNLQDALFDRRNTDAANALRITATRLRKVLGQSGLPEDTYVTVEKSMYYLKPGNGNLRIQMDAVLMEKIYYQALEIEDERERQKKLEAACSLYRGEFLPAMSGEVWVETLRSRFQDIYFKSVREACAVMKKHKDYEKILKLCDSALEVYPLAEWTEWKIEALTALKRYGEARRAYELAVQRFMDEAGNIPPVHVLTSIREIGEQIEHLPGEVEDIRKELMEEEWSAGAYRCTYPGFVDCFRMIVRSVERGKKNGFLIICTIRDGRDGPVEDSGKLQTYGDMLCEVIHECLRRGDIFTKYSPDQVLIIANDLKGDKCRIVENRIISGMHRRCGQKVSMHIQDISLRDWCKKGENYKADIKKPDNGNRRGKKR